MTQGHANRIYRGLPRTFIDSIRHIWVSQGLLRVNWPKTNSIFPNDSKVCIISQRGRNVSLSLLSITLHSPSSFFVWKSGKLAFLYDHKEPDFIFTNQWEIWIFLVRPICSLYVLGWLERWCFYLWAASQSFGSKSYLNWFSPLIFCMKIWKNRHSYVTSMFWGVGEEVFLSVGSLKALAAKAI